MKKYLLYDRGGTKDIKLSVAIPCYNGKAIGWLCVEGLCNQVDVDFDWEIVICEELHSNMLGVDFFKYYVDRLLKIRCKRVTYLQLDKWVNLSNKWKIIGQHLDNYAGGFVLQAIDDYSPSRRLAITNKFINQYDWVDFKQGYFYSFQRDKLILYSPRARMTTNIHIAFKSKYAKNLRVQEKRTANDAFLFKTISSINPNIRKYTHEKLLIDGVATDGYNNLSKSRDSFYKNPKPVLPFISTDKTIDDLGLPDNVVKKIKSMRLT